MYKYRSILNIGAGKRKPIGLDGLNSYFAVNIDPSYYINRCTDIIDIERRHKEWDLRVESYGNLPPVCEEETFYSDLGWKDFIPKYFRKFDKVIIYRYLEHVPLVEVPYFIYMISTIIKSGGIVEGIVPDYKLLAKRILNENPFDAHFERENILTTTEVVNEPYDPHASIWTSDRIRYFFEMENRFRINEVRNNFRMDDRDIYLWFTAVRK